MAQQTTREFFEELKDWSQRKHQILDMYLSSASKILGSTWDTVYYVDGFAGRGTYGEGATFSKGSPLKAAEKAQEYRTQGKYYSLRCINVEKDDENFAQLQAVTAQFGDLVTNLSGTFVANVERILHIVGDQAVICFLDPFGVSGIDWWAVEGLIDRGGPTDLWIRFDTRTIRRLDGFFDSGDVRGRSKLETLARVYGILDLEHLHRRLDGPTPDVRLAKARDLYMECLVDAFQRCRRHGYAASYPIRSVQEPEKHKYEMIYATGHHKGFILASDIVYRVEETHQQAVQDYQMQQLAAQPRQLTLFDSAPAPTREEEETAVILAVKAAIWQQCAGKQLTREWVQRLLFPAWFGKMTTTHVTAALKALKAEGRITAATGAPSKDTTIFTFKKPT